jgi:cation:H+ antiporter
MGGALALVLGGLLVLTAGGEALVRGASALALRLGLTPLFIGLTVVAFGSSAPELAVSVNAVVDGLGDVAMGNVVGSNVANVALVIGLAALVRPLTVEAKLVRIDMPIMLACSLLVCAMMLTDGRIGRAEGALLVGLLAGYMVFCVWEVRRGRPVAQDGADGGVTPPGARIVPNALLIVTGLAGLALGASLFVRGAVLLAEMLGLSAAVIGLTVVAVGTSLPELATSVVAAWRRQGDIAVGNVVGSNIFNLLAVLGCTALVLPVVAGGIGVADLTAMLLVAAVLWLMVARGARVNRLEGLGLLVFYVAYTGWLLSYHP